MSSEVGVLDEDALQELLDEDPDAGLSLLADLAGATDRELAAKARRLAARIMIHFARSGAPRAGAARMRTRPLSSTPGDIDIDASMEAFAANPARGSGPRVTDPSALRVSAWTRHDTALCLLVDRSGSMAGDRLATAAIGAAAVLHRVPRDSSVVCFSDRAVVVRSQDSDRDVEAVLGDVFTLRGFGITDLGLALRAGASQLARSTAGRRVAVLLSDCRATAGGDPLPHAAGMDELVVLAPAEDTADAEAFAMALGARWAPVAGPSSIPAALDSVLGGVVRG
ncbi:MAG: VWA domain-containing protein [Microthrixaceae bacterium]|nr:VWA domain-containing protein [Microthrixaceae bacterium]